MDSEQLQIGQDLEVQPAAETTEEVAAEESKTQSDGGTAAGEGRKNGSRSAALESLKPGAVVKGRVRNIVDFGAFIDIGVGRDGLAHVSSLKRAGIDQSLKVGDVIEVVVRRVNLDENRISLAIPEPERAPKTRLQDLAANSVVDGTVVRLADFGAFVDIGAQTDGLLHVSELPWGYVNHPSEVLKVGDTVHVRILDVDVRKRRISLSMKEPEQVEEPDEEEPAAPEAPEERIPTAFEAAFEKARAAQRRRQRQS